MSISNVDNATNMDQESMLVYMECFNNLEKSSDLEFSYLNVEMLVDKVASGYE